MGAEGTAIFTESHQMRQSLQDNSPRHGRGRPLRGRKGLLSARQHKARLGFLIGERQGIPVHARGENVGVGARDLHCLTHHHD